MLVAMYGIIENSAIPARSSPASSGPSLLVLALYMSAILPVNVAARAHRLAMGLFAIDVFARTHGILTREGSCPF